MEETLKYLLDQALKYPGMRTSLLKHCSAQSIGQILESAGIQLEPSQLQTAAAYLHGKLESLENHEK